MSNQPDMSGTPMIDHNGDAIYTGSFVAINDVWNGDTDRWEKLLEATNDRPGDLFHRLLDLYDRFCGGEMEPEYPDDPSTGGDNEEGSTSTTASGMIHNCCSTVSIFPGKDSVTSVFGLFSVETTTTASPRNIHIKFKDFNPKITCKAIKLDCVQFNDILQSYFTTDLSSETEKEFDISLEKYGTISNVIIRVYYEIVDYQIPNE